MTPRDIEKLKAIGYAVEGQRFVYFPGTHTTLAPTWKNAKAHAQSPEGLKATMADKVRLIGRVVIRAPVKGVNNWDAWQDEPDDIEAEGDSPEAAVDALFWKVP